MRQKKEGSQKRYVITSSYHHGKLGLNSTMELWDTVQIMHFSYPFKEEKDWDIYKTPFGPHTQGTLVPQHSGCHACEQNNLWQHERAPRKRNAGAGNKKLGQHAQKW